MRKSAQAIAWAAWAVPTALPVAAHFTSEGHTEANVLVMIID